MRIFMLYWNAEIVETNTDYFWRNFINFVLDIGKSGQINIEDALKNCKLRLYSLEDMTEEDLSELFLGLNKIEYTKTLLNDVLGASKTVENSLYVVNTLRNKNYAIDKIDGKDLFELNFAERIER